MAAPLVTIAIPFYNNARTILDAVRSVYAQTYQNWELILLNDGSTDESLELVGRINDVRVRIVDDGSNRGLVYRLNQIPYLANGQYIARMDGDDLMHPLRIEKQVALLQADERFDLVDSAAWTMDTQGRPIGKRGFEQISRRPADVIRRALLLHAAVTGKKAWFLANAYDPKYVRAEDYELWCRTYGHSNFGRVCEPLYIIREGHINVTNYVQSMRTLRLIFNDYGRLMLPDKLVKYEILKTYLKSGIYKILGAVNMQDRLSARRNTPLHVVERREAEGIVQMIKRTELPLKPR